MICYNKLKETIFWKEGKEMAISYEGLWNILNERGISKTEFRKLINISTVTLAKMSKNEPVSMSVIETICLTFQCEIEEIMKIEKKEQKKKWGRIQEKAVYVIRLFYLTEEWDGENDIDFLYGYAIMADEGVESKKRWELLEHIKQENIRVWEITSMIRGDTLWILIRAMEQNKNLGEFFRESSTELHDNLRNKRKEEWHNHFLNAQIIHFNKDYRPEIVLIPERESSLLIKGMQPFHAFGEDPLISESFVCRWKRKLYFTKEKDYDINKMELIYNFFKKEKFLVNGIRDLCRIGDFEVFSTLVDKIGQKELFEIESQVERLDSRQKVLKGFKITVFSKYLSGSYILGVTTYNAGNPTSSKIYDIIVNGQDVTRTINFAESSGKAIVCIWEKREEKQIQLIGYKQISIVRDLVVDMKMSERTITIEDKYTKKFQETNGKKGKDSVNCNMRNYSSWENRIENKGNDPWRKEFMQVADDFEELYGTEIAESRFFAQGMKGHEEFLKWLNEEINKKEIEDIWIFDPYIDADSVTRILRSLEDTKIQMKIVTDAKAPSRNQNNRIGILQNTCYQLEELLKSRFSFYAFQANKCLLHDRIILLCGQKYIPIVYNMSNSLDNMAMYTPSIVCKLSRNSAKEVATYYLELYQKEQEKGHIQVLWEKEIYSQRQSVVKVSKKEQEKDLDDFVEFFNEKLKKEKLGLLHREKGRIVFPDFLDKEEKIKMMEVLCINANEYWEKICFLCANIEDTTCIELEKKLEESYNQDWGEKLQEILIKELDKDREEQKKEGCKVYQKEDFREILQGMGELFENLYGVQIEPCLSQKGEQALGILIIKDFFRYQMILEQLDKKEGSLQVLKQERAMIYKLICIMEERKKLSKELAEKCLVSENQNLIAVGIQWFIKQRKIETVIDKVKDSFYCHEFFKEMIIDLQVEDCQKEHFLKSEKFEEEKKSFLLKMQEVKESWVNYFSDTLTAKQLEDREYFKEIGTRSKEDVCDLIVMLYKANKLSVTELEIFLTDCFLEKLEKDYKKEDGYWRIEDFQNGELFLVTLKEFGTEIAGKLAVENLISWEKKLVKVLHDVFLQQKNYTKWKCYIDMLIWCCTMRIFCQNFWKEYEIWMQADRNRQTRQKEIQGLLKKYQSTLKKYSEAYRLFCEIKKQLTNEV